MSKDLVVEEAYVVETSAPKIIRPSSPALKATWS